MLISGDAARNLHGEVNVLTTGAQFRFWLDAYRKCRVTYAVFCPHWLVAASINEFHAVRRSRQQPNWISRGHVRCPGGANIDVHHVEIPDSLGDHTGRSIERVVLFEVQLEEHTACFPNDRFLSRAI